MNLIYVDVEYNDAAEQPWRSVVKSGDNEEVLFVSSESYHNRADALHAIDLAFGTQANVYRRESEHGNFELRLAKDYQPDVIELGPDGEAEYKPGE